MSWGKEGWRIRTNKSTNDGGNIGKRENAAVFCHSARNETGESEERREMWKSAVSKAPFTYFYFNYYFLILLILGYLYILNIHLPSGKLLASVFCLSVASLSTEDCFSLSIHFILYNLIFQLFSTFISHVFWILSRFLVSAALSWSIFSFILIVLYQVRSLIKLGGLIMKANDVK